MSGIPITTMEERKFSCKRTVMDGKEKKDAVWCFLCDIIQFAGYIGALLLAVGLAVWGQMEACVFGALISALLNLQNCIKSISGGGRRIAGAFKSL